MANPHLAPEEEEKVAHVDGSKVTSTALATASASVGDPRNAPASPLPWKLWSGWGPAKDGYMRLERIGPAPSADWATADAPIRCGLRAGSEIDMVGLRADLEFIVHACNNHHAIIAALKDARDVLDVVTDNDDVRMRSSVEARIRRVLDRVDIAIAKAEGR